MEKVVKKAREQIYQGESHFIAGIYVKGFACFLNFVMIDVWKNQFV